MLIGEGGIPREIMEEMPDHHLQIFMREPDPAEWPPEMEHLVQYLSSEERIGFTVTAILRRHDPALTPSLKEWASSAWKELRGKGEVTGEDVKAMKEAMAKHLKERLFECLEERGR